MSQIDFAIAFLIMLSVLTYSLVSVSNKLTSDFGFYNEKRLEEAASLFSRQLLNVQDEKSLLSSFKNIKASFNEIGGKSHEEFVDVTLTPPVNRTRVYDNFFNEIPSTILNNGDNVTVSFKLSFSPSERKYANIFYNDIPTESIAYTSNVTATNVTGMVLSEEDFYLLSQERCSQLTNYEEVKSNFGFSDDFNITECNFGLPLPLGKNVIVKSIPILVERNDGKIYPSLVKIRVW